LCKKDRKKDVPCKRTSPDFVCNRDHCWVTLHKMGGLARAGILQRIWERKYYILTSWSYTHTRTNTPTQTHIHTHTHTHRIRKQFQIFFFLEIKFYDQNLEMRFENKKNGTHSSSFALLRKYNVSQDIQFLMAVRN
jgi:hypothetical protein